MMRKLVLLATAMVFVLSSFAQYHSSKQSVKNFAAPYHKSSVTNVDLPVVGNQPENNLVSNKAVLDDPILATTRYDLQTNTSNERRLYLYPDGTVGAAATISTQDASWTDRGTGYNYFDGTSWGPVVSTRVETSRTGWPSYHPFGPTGELVIAHQASGPLVMNTRPVKGTGNWTQKNLPALPSGIPAILWPRAVTNGPDHNFIHIIALTEPVASGGQTYQGLDGALLYCHSLDGGVTFSSWTLLPGMTSAQYTGFSADIYAFAEPHGDTLAFTVGDSWIDQFIMKSVDNGTNWTKTVIHASPYNLGGTSPNFFYCPDGTMGIALDKAGMAHVAFGLQCDSGTPTAGYYRPFTQGVAYWNENQPALRDDLNPDSLLATNNLIAWVKDTNVYSIQSTELTSWYVSLTSNPELVIDDNNKIFLIFSGATSLMDGNNYDLRHIYGRDGVITPDGSDVVWHNDTLVDITNDWIQYGFSDCVYASTSPTSDDFIYVLFQQDEYGGSFVKKGTTTPWQGQSQADDNSIVLIKWEKPLPWEGVNDKKEKPSFSVGQNTPNPVNGLTKVNVYLQNPGNLSLKVTNLTGQTLMCMEKANVQAGVCPFVIDGSQLSAGIYFYTVKQGNKSITKKMIVQ